MPIIESSLPPVSADEREPLLIAFDSTGAEASATYTNRLYEYVHLASKGKVAPGTKTTEIKERDGSLHLLVLLPFPMQAACLTAPHTFRFSAAILNQRTDGSVEGWLVNRHDAALATWATMHPEKS